MPRDAPSEVRAIEAGTLWVPIYKKGSPSPDRHGQCFLFALDKTDKSFQKAGYVEFTYAQSRFRSAALCIV